MVVVAMRVTGAEFVAREIMENEEGFATVGPEW